jgi:hypothetical protein
MRIMMCCVLALAYVAPSFGGELVDGVLLVDGEPFYPLSSWNSPYTSPEDIDRLGMNTSYRGGPSTPEAVEEFRGFMRACDRLGIQMVPYLSYGGAGVTPWAPESVRAISKLASEPNLLAWYVGDDIGPQHLAGIEQTVGILRAETPTIPTVADYIEEERPDAQKTFTESIDIRCQYTYPIPDEPYTEYLAFFDRQRDFVGDPLWTWVQSFMWGRTGRMLEVGAEGPGPIPDPEQVRLLAFAAINRGVRGLLFFPHHELHRQPELAAAVALTCREIRLFEGHLAAGTPTYDLETSSSDVLRATAFEYEESTVIAAALFKERYHSWIDEGIIHDGAILCPWNGDAAPRAFLVDTPEVVECDVAMQEDGRVEIVVPRMEICGFILVTDSPREIRRLRNGVKQIHGQMRTLLAPAAAVQVRKMADRVWQLGHDDLYSQSDVMTAMRAAERCSDLVVAGDYADALVAWKRAMYASRIEIGRIMAFAESRRSMMSRDQAHYLMSPHGLHNIPGLGTAPEPDDPWQYIRDWKVVGPFPLEWNESQEEKPAPGFMRAYGPETIREARAIFVTVDGTRGWHAVSTGLDALLDFLPYFDTTYDVVCYARATVVAPSNKTVQFSLGSNDGARVWVNGADVFQFSSAPHGRTAKPHQNEFTAPLKKGPNEILVKVENLGASWQLYLAVYDPDRAFLLRAE